MYNPKILKPYLIAKLDNRIPFENKELYSLCGCVTDNQKASIRSLKSEYIREYEKKKYGESPGENIESVTSKTSNSYTKNIVKESFQEVKEEIEVHQFYKLFMTFPILPNFLRDNAINYMFHLTSHCKCNNHIENQVYGVDYTFYEILYEMYDDIDTNALPDRYDFEFFLDYTINFDTKFKALFSWLYFHKKVNELTEDELIEVEHSIEAEKRISLDLLERLQSQSLTPEKIRYYVLECCFYCGLCYLNDSVIEFDYKKELGHLFKLNYELFDEPKPYQDYIDRFEAILC
jgi:hypothetical protein